MVWRAYCVRRPKAQTAVAGHGGGALVTPFVSGLPIECPGCGYGCVQPAPPARPPLAPTPPTRSWRAPPAQRRQQVHPPSPPHGGCSAPARSACSGCPLTAGAHCQRVSCRQGRSALLRRSGAVALRVRCTVVQIRGWAAGCVAPWAQMPAQWQASCGASCGMLAWRPNRPGTPSSPLAPIATMRHWLALLTDFLCV